MLKIKNFPLATLELDEEKNILFFRVKQDIVVDIAEIKEMIGYVQEVMGNKTHYAVIDFGSSLGSTTEGRKAYAESAYLINNRLADAFLVKSLAVRLIANFFINVTKPKVATRLFTDEKEAIKWLEGLRNKPKKNRTLQLS